MRPQVITRRNLLQKGAQFLAATAPMLALGAGPALSQTATSRGYEIMDAQKAYEAAQKGEIILIDIRTPREWAETGIGEGAIALDMREKDFVQNLVKLRQDNPETPLALICRTGNRSGYVVQTLAQQGFPGLVDVSEGMVGGPNGQGWITRGLPVYPGVQAEIEKRRAAALGE